MAILRKAPLCLLLLASVGCFAQGRRHDRQNRHHGVSNPPPAMVEPPAAPAQPSPPATSSLPPNAPQVSYRNGLLTVVANNSTLGDILNAVQAKTGAHIDYPAGQAQDRVVASYGPAPATQVMASLLNGSRFDYILLGSPGRPDLLSKAILTSKEAAPAPGAAENPAPTAARNNPPPPQPAEEDTDAGDDTAAEQPAEQPPPPQPAPQATPQPAQPNQPAQGPKTPEQLLQELQRLQQQQQQQQQQNGPLQPPANPPEQ